MASAEQNDEGQLGQRYMSLETLVRRPVKVLEEGGNALSESMAATPSPARVA